MKCEDVKPRLSEYMDKALDAGATAAVAGHLSSCAQCVEDLAGLAESRRLVATLPEVDPPVGFTERVMARVREFDEEPTFWERLFSPLRIKMPIHATAVVLIAILAVYLYQKEPPHKQTSPLSQSNFSVDAEQAQSETALPASGLPEPKQKKAKVVGEAAQASREEALVDKKDLAKGLPARSAPDPQAVSKPIAAKESAIGGAAPISPARRESAAQPPTVGHAGAQPQLAEAPVAAPSEVKGRSVAAQPMVLEFRSASLPSDVELVIRRRAGPHRELAWDSLDTLRKSKESISSPGAAALSSTGRLLPDIPESPKPQTLWLTIPRSQYEQIKRELVAIGTVESEFLAQPKEKETASKADTQVQIKLTILPPIEPEPAAPSTPANR